MLSTAPTKKAAPISKHDQIVICAGNVENWNYTISYCHSLTSTNPKLVASRVLPFVLGARLCIDEEDTVTDFKVFDRIWGWPGGHSFLGADTTPIDRAYRWYKSEIGNNKWLMSLDEFEHHVENCCTSKLDNEPLNCDYDTTMESEANVKLVEWKVWKHEIGEDGINGAHVLIKKKLYADHDHPFISRSLADSFIASLVAGENSDNEEFLTEWEVIDSDEEDADIDIDNDIDDDDDELPGCGLLDHSKIVLEPVDIDKDSANLLSQDSTVRQLAKLVTSEANGAGPLSAGSSVNENGLLPNGTNPTKHASPDDTESIASLPRTLAKNTAYPTPIYSTRKRSSIGSRTPIRKSPHTFKRRRSSGINGVPTPKSSCRLVPQEDPDPRNPFNC
ncbi:uncharacterized protein BJ171DRAFT_486535 [Polychytrium aggregatum]|uniref:uncharacterized protein n=1 Tax=Polychytrium aggregatum TaxID=110093 RepID=UPI0022FDC1EE|nr:uncharacterized protein BJ171DRAFT_486535 [Polychytrium aggregatum]KAI9209352.1 hypothetical protein BJ171DRAFT_486535 [Polychytrium aggregatum]